MFRQRSSPTAQPRTPSGFRAYAVGDIHGRLDLLDQILTMIEQDAERSPARKSLLIFLGDLIDRGPDSGCRPISSPAIMRRFCFACWPANAGCLKVGLNSAVPSACGAMEATRLH